MSEHIDNIHHSHGQKWGYPHVTILLYLNDDYDGGEFVVLEKKSNQTKVLLVYFLQILCIHTNKIVTEKEQDGV